MSFRARQASLVAQTVKNLPAQEYTVEKRQALEPVVLEKLVNHL